MRIAIVGSGIAGLASAHWLQRAHDVTVFEADDRLGGHAHTVDAVVDGREVAVDTGFIVFNRPTYPLFRQLLREIGVESVETEMSFGVAHEPRDVEWATHGIRSLFPDAASLLRPELYRMAADLRRFFADAKQLIAQPDEKVSLGEWTTGRGYSRDFTELYLRPMATAIWSATPDQVFDFPALTLARFFENHQLLAFSGREPWRTIPGGSRTYVEALTAPLEGRIRTGCPVRQVERRADGVTLRFQDDGVERFDRVVLATHAPQAAAMLDATTPAERAVLGAFRTQQNVATLHTDVSVMPTRRRAWASWNIRVPERRVERVFVTYWMNRLQPLGLDTPVLVTLNGEDRIDPAQTVARFHYAHPVFDGPAIRAQALHREIDGGGGVHFAGAYWRYGFHEDGAWSAARVARALGVDV